MKETYITEWIWKKNKDTNAQNLTIRMSNNAINLNLPKGNYLVKLFKLESEVN